MKFKPKDQKTAILIFASVIVVVFFAKQAGFASTQSATRILYTANEGRHNWSASYRMLDGTMQKTVYTLDGTLNLSVETESGAISMEIMDNDGNVIFDQTNIGTASFAVEAPEKAVVRIEADHHRGSFHIEGN